MYRSQTQLFPWKVQVKLGFYVSDSEPLFLQTGEGNKTESHFFFLSPRTYAACVLRARSVGVAQRGSHAPARGSLATPAADV